MSITETAPETVSNILTIPVSKGGGTVTIDPDSIPGHIWSAIIAEGLKAYVNKGMTKITTKGLEGEDLAKAQAAAMAKAKDNVEAILDGTMKVAGRKATGKSKTSGAVMTEALRLARGLVKDEMKKAGLKVSHYSAKEITIAAKAYIEADPSIIDKAIASLAARDSVTVSDKIDLKSLMHADPKLVAKAEEAKAAKKKSGTLSAKQAGMVKPKAKPQQATAH